MYYLLRALFGTFTASGTLLVINVSDIVLDRDSAGLALFCTDAAADTSR